jgi:hypothetical protein
MCIGAEAGCHVVPDAIAPIDMMFDWLEPTRMPMSFSDMTSSGPMFIVPMPVPPASGVGFVSCPSCVIPGIFMLLMPPEVSGLAAGDAFVCGVWLFMFMFMGIPLSIFCPGEGEAGSVVALGVDGICIPGILFMSVFAGEDEGVGDCNGVDVPFTFMPFMFILCASCFFGAGRCNLFRRMVDLAFRFAFDLGFRFDISMPGILCISCCARMVMTLAANRVVTMSAHSVARTLLLIV